MNHDDYYMDLAIAVKSGADCTGTNVGAVIALEDRVVSTGYNGTPAGFSNCKDGGCLRCLDSKAHREERYQEMVVQSHRPGEALDRCICVHAEQNAFLTAAKFGIALKGSTLYSTSSPCFGCLKEACQIGIQRIVYKEWYPMRLAPELTAQYIDLYKHLSNGTPENFEQISGDRPDIETNQVP